MRILAAGLIGIRHRATTAVVIAASDLAVAYREIDTSLHLLDGQIDILLLDGAAMSGPLLATLRRMRSVDEAAAVGVSCRTSDQMTAALGLTRVEQLDIVSISAPLLLSYQADEWLHELSQRQIGIIAWVPDGTASTTVDIDSVKVGTRRHDLSTMRDLLVKMALSDDRIASVVTPGRRMSDIANAIHIAGSKPFNATEMAAIRSS